jgi:central kinetochore subunit Mis15/CHL4
LSRSSLLSISLDWLDENNQALSAPYLENFDEEYDEPADFYPPARSLEELQELYTDMQTRKGSKREVIDRIVEGDWRDGLSLYQLAIADLQYLHDHPTSQRWSAYRVVPLRIPHKDADPEQPLKVDKESLIVPRFHPSTFLQKLQSQILPDVKAHYTFERHKTLPLLLLRIFILDSPYNTSLAATTAGGDHLASSSESARTVYIGFPDASPHVYISNSSSVGAVAAGETKSLRALVIEGIPKAISRPRERYTLKSTSLATRNLTELLNRRGAGRTNAAGGGWGLYADEKKKESPLDNALPTPPVSDAEAVRGGNERKRALSPATERDERAAKRARKLAQARFGDSAKIDDGKGVERVDIIIEDQFRDQRLATTQDDAGDAAVDEARRRNTTSRRSNVEELLARDKVDDEDDGESPDGDDSVVNSWRPKIRLTFHGSHVFAGVRQLVELGVVDGERMPGWMTGEEGVTIGAVRYGRIRGHKGSGM